MTERPGPPTGSEYADSLRDVMTHVAERQSAEAAQAKPAGPSPLSHPPVVIGVAVLFLAVMLWDLHAYHRPPPTAPPAAAQAGAEMSVLAARQAVERFKSEHGRLPKDLPEAGVPEGLAGYRLTPDGYELTAPKGDEGHLSYSSSEGPPPFIKKLILDAGPGNPGRSGSPEAPAGGGGQR